MNIENKIWDTQYHGKMYLASNNTNNLSQFSSNFPAWELGQTCFSPLTIAYSMYLSFVKKSGGRFVMSLQTQGMCQLEYECLKYSYFLSQERILKTVGKSLCYKFKMICFKAVYIFGITLNYWRKDCKSIYLWSGIHFSYTKYP